MVSNEPSNGNASKSGTGLWLVERPSCFELTVKTDRALACHQLGIKAADWCILTLLHVSQLTELTNMKDQSECLAC